MIAIGTRDDAVGVVKLLDHNTVGAFVSYTALVDKDKMTKEYYDINLARMLQDFLNKYIQEEN
jgi:hypothetical protein